MPEIIFDCCCISNFALSDSLFVLESLYKKTAIITNFVSAEILRGVQQGHEGLARVREALKEGWLKEVVLSGAREKALFETLSVSLGLGEASSIAMAKCTGSIFACDDRAARREAGLLDVKLTGTLGILKKALRNKVVDLAKGDLILTRMIDLGFYSSAKSLRDI